MLGCTSPGTGCDISGLQCGQSYTVTVTATNGVCTGQSTNQTIQSGTHRETVIFCQITGGRSGYGYGYGTGHNTLKVHKGERCSNQNDGVHTISESSRSL